MRVSRSAGAFVIVASRRRVGDDSISHVDAKDLQREARLRRVGVTGAQRHEPAADGAS